MAAGIGKRKDWTQYSGHRIYIQKMKKETAFGEPTWHTTKLHKKKSISSTHFLSWYHFGSYFPKWVHLFCRFQLIFRAAANDFSTTQFYIHSHQSCEKELTYLGICQVSVLLGILFCWIKKKCSDSLQYRVQGRKLVHYCPNLWSLPQSEGEGDLVFSAKLSNCSLNSHFTHLQSRSTVSSVLICYSLFG